MNFEVIACDVGLKRHEFEKLECFNEQQTLFL